MLFSSNIGTIVDLFPLITSSSSYLLAAEATESLNSPLRRRRQSRGERRRQVSSSSYHIVPNSSSSNTNVATRNTNNRLISYLYLNKPYYHPHNHQHRILVKSTSRQSSSHRIRSHPIEIETTRSRWICSRQ